MTVGCQIITCRQLQGTTYSRQTDREQTDMVQACCEASDYITRKVLVIENGVRESDTPPTDVGIGFQEGPETGSISYRDITGQDIKSKAN